MRKALVVGIDNYVRLGNNLHGCVNDAHSVKKVLERHEDGRANFDCRLLTAEKSTGIIERGKLTDQVKELFQTDTEITLFYFAGHGHIESAGGYLLTSDSGRGDEGIPLVDILHYANGSPAKNKIIILDSCHSGIAGTLPQLGQSAFLSEGTTVLTASTDEQYASEENGRGVFTTLLVDALGGAAANITGDITPSSVYAHIDQSLGSWEQRPVFKTNVKKFISLRKTSEKIPLVDLRMIANLFPSQGFSFPLNPTYEPEMKGRDKGMPAPDEENTKIFSILQKYNRHALLVPEGAPHMWHAAMQSKSCRLTALGEHYRRLVEKDRI